MILKLRALTLLTDYLLLLAAFTLAYFARVGFLFSTDFPFQPYFYSALAAAVLWIISLLVFHAYSPAVRFTRPIHLIKLAIGGLTGTALFGLIFYFTEKALFSRLLLIYVFLFGTLLMLLFHLIMQEIENHLIKKGYGNIRLLIIGSNRGVKAFISTLKEQVSPYVPIAILDGYGTKQKEVEGVPVLGKLNVLEQTIDEYRIDAIVQGDNVEQVVNIVQFCQQRQIDYYLLPYLLGIYQQEVRVARMEKPLIAPERVGEVGLFERLLG
ncbi:MAG: hypothetical protein Q8O95_05335 [bacterium]|nr:hypothetical protein [bacterium]